MELLKHLRTIHFLVVLASLLTFLPILSGSSSDVSIALRQFERITAVKNSWNTWVRKFALEQAAWLKQQGVTWFDFDQEPVFVETQQLKNLNLIPQTEHSIWTIKFDDFPMYFFLSVKESNASPREFILAKPSGKLEATDTHRLDISFPSTGTGGEFPPDTIGRFRNFWDAASEPKVWIGEDIAREAYFVREGTKAATLQVKIGQALQSTQLGFLNRSHGGCRKASTVIEKTDKKSYNEWFCHDIRGGKLGTLVVAARSREPRSTQNLQEWLLKEFNFKTSSGSFSDSFPELHRISEDYQDLPLEKAKAILVGELERGGERIEFLGLNVPENIMATWGSIAILMLQVYFFIHLRTLRTVGLSTYGSAREVAWIGLYKDAWARLTSVITVFFLPSGVTIYAAYSASVISDSLPWLSIGLTISVVFASGYSAYLIWIENSRINETQERIAAT